MRVLFASAPLPGHLDWGGVLKSAQALQQRGHSVTWASGRTIEQSIVDAGLSFHAVTETGWRWPPPPPLTPTTDLSPQQLLRQKQLRALDQWLDAARVQAAVAAMTDIIRTTRPDVVVGEMFMAATALAAEVAEIPFVVAGWPAPTGLAPADPAEPLLVEARGRLEMLLRRWRVDGVNWTRQGPPALCSPLLHLSYFSPTWYGSVAHGPQTRYVGGPRPAAVSGAPPFTANHAPSVFITLGTTFARDPAFFVAAIRATQALGALPVVATGDDDNRRTIEKALGDQARGPIFMASRVDYGAVLPHVSAAIHHGGAGTTHGLITYAVPQIVVPHAGDQIRQGQGVAATGIGFHMAPKQATTDNLTAALALILPDRSAARVNAAALQQEFSELGGPDLAARLIEEVGAGRSPAG